MERTARTLVVAVATAGLVLLAGGCRPKPPAVTPPAEAPFSGPVRVAAPSGPDGEVLRAIAMRVLAAGGVAATAAPSSGADLVIARDPAPAALTAVATAPAHSGAVVCVRKDLSDRYGLRSIEDLARYANGGGGVRLECPAWFTQGASGVTALQAAYGFTVPRDRIETRPDSGTGSALAALAAGADDVAVAAASGTDPAIDDLGLVILEDPRSFAATASPVVAVSAAALGAHPRLADAFDAPFAGLTTEVLRALARRVAYGGEPVDAVAAEYLAGNPVE